MFCKHCGKQLPDNAKFCNYCGTPVTQTTSDSALAPEAPVSVEDNDATVLVSDDNSEKDTDAAQNTPVQPIGMVSSQNPDQQFNAQNQFAPNSNQPNGIQNQQNVNQPYGAQYQPNQNQPYGLQGQPNQSQSNQNQYNPNANLPFGMQNPYGYNPGAKVKSKESGNGIPTYLLIILGVVLAAIVCVIIFFVVRNIKSKNEESAAMTSEETMDEETDDSSSDEQADESEEPDTTSKENSADENTTDESEEADEEDSEYIIPDSDTRVITESDLEGLDEDQLRLARNELYARHGRMFKDEQLQAYFDSLSWYHGTIQPDDFTDEMLTDIEKQNKDTIVAYEEKMGYK